jgi:amino-acid N-acetyltransferase
MVSVPDPGCSWAIHALVDRMLERAVAGGLDTVALLTATAAGFFPRFGFRVVERSQVPVAVQEPVEFQDACPASATAMLLELRRSQR